MSSIKVDEFTVSFPGEETKDFEPAATTDLGVTRFPVHTHFWEALDPILKEDLDRMVEKRVMERLSKSLEQERSTIFLKAKEEAHEEGVQQAKQELQKVLHTLNAISTSLVDDKEKILRSHEAIWCRAMDHLLRRFLVPHAQVVSDTFRRWLDESMGGFPQNIKVRIHLAPLEFKSISSILGDLMQSRWELVKDDSVPIGEIYCECDAGGIFFSPTVELGRLDSWIDEFKHPSTD